MRFIPQRCKFTHILLCILIFITGACSTSSESSSSVTYGLTLAPSGIDPHLNASSELGIPLRSVYDTLVFLDPKTGEFVPGLAENWDISSDGLIYTFNLRRDVIFHDGTPFNAQAVIANIDRILNPENHSQKAAFMLGPLSSMEIKDEFTVALHLSEPYAPLLDSLSDIYFGMASPSALEKWGTTEYQFHQVGTGPYRFVEYVPNDHLTLARNPEYAWSPSVYHQQQAKFENIIFSFYEDSSTRALALESGEIDIIGEVPSHDASRLSGSSDFSLIPITIPGQPMQFFFNTRLPPTDDASVRQALILAVDRTYAVKTVFGDYSSVADGPLSSVIYDFDALYPFPKYDFAMAEALLDNTGWIDEEGTGQRSRDGVLLKLHIVSPPWGSNPEVAQLIQADWEAIGADVSLEISPGFGQLKEAQENGAYNAIGINFFGTDPDLLRSFYSSTGIYNWSGFEDPRLDELLQTGRTSLDPAKRTDIYRQFAAIVREEALLIPIRDYVNLVVVSSRIEGLHFSAHGWYPFLIDLQMAP
jgi:peptide/nickel transport system substrate-binding protein